MIKNAICRLFHRQHWAFVLRKMTGPVFPLSQQRHIGVFNCTKCGQGQHIKGDIVRREDSQIALNAQIPRRGFAMRVHHFLGGRA